MRIVHPGITLPDKAGRGVRSIALIAFKRCMQNSLWAVFHDWMIFRAPIRPAKQEAPFSGRRGDERIQFSADRRSMRRSTVGSLSKGGGSGTGDPFMQTSVRAALNLIADKAFDPNIEIRRARLPQDRKRGPNESNPSMRRQAQFTCAASQSAPRLLCRICAFRSGSGSRRSRSDTSNRWPSEYGRPHVRAG